MSTEEKCVISTFRPSGRHQPNFPMPAPTQMAAVAKVRSLLCERNTQEGSPWNTFTESELAELRRNLPDLPHPVVAARERRGAEPSSSSSFPPESSSAATNGDRVNLGYHVPRLPIPGRCVQRITLGKHTRGALQMR